MEYKFTAYGHKNILAVHKKTIEFTKDKGLTLRGDCIVGVNSDFDIEAVRNFIKNICGKNNNNITIMIKIKHNNEEHIEKFNAVLNPSFNDETEIVIRKSDVATHRTFAVSSEKGALDLSREFVKYLRNHEQRIEIIFLAGEF